MNFMQETRVEMGDFATLTRHWPLSSLTADKSTCSSSNIIRMSWVSHVTRMREIKYAYRVLFQKPEGKMITGKT
jgi:hypothetical protein